MVSDGEADAFITAGNTGAAYGIAMLHTLKRIEGVKRPALTVIFPINKRPITFLDVGANIETKPEWMVQFARMGKIYAETVLGIQSARVGLLSNGTERGKGTPVVQATDEFLHGNLEGYVGNIEPIDIMFGKVEVVVSDGFSGNILLKTFEASTRYLSNVIREELTSGILTSVGGLLARPAFNRARKRMDAFEVGGAPLLGVNGVVIISHGSSNANAIKNAVNQAAIAVKSNVVELIRKDIVKVQE